MNFKRFMKSAFCGIACAAAVLSFSGCDKYGKMLRDDPEEYIETVMKNTAEEMLKSKNEDISDVISKASENGTFTVDFEAEGVKFSGEMYADENQGAMSQSYTLANGGQSAQLYVYGDRDGMKFGTVGQSGSHIYDVKFSDLKEKMAASIFNPDSGSAYALDSKTYAMYMGYAEEIAAAIGQETTVSDNNKQTVIGDYFKDRGRTVKEKVDTDIGGENVRANIISYTLNKDDLNELTDRLAENYDGADPSEEATLNYIKKSLDNLESCNMEITFFVNSKTHVLMKSDINVATTPDGGFTSEMYAEILLGADPANAAEQSIRIGGGSGGEDAYYLISSTRTENGSPLIITSTTDSGTEQLASVSTVIDGDSYSVSADILSEYSAGISGTLTYDDSSVTATVDSISFGNFSYAPSAVAVMRKGGEILKLDADKEFLDITEEELTELLDNIDADFTGIFE